MTPSKGPLILRHWRLALALIGVTAFAGGGAVLAAVSDPATGLVFHTVAPVRVLDTRAGNGAPAAPLGPGATLDVAIPGLPDDATAVQVNVTADRGSTSSFLTVYATGDSRSDTSTVNWPSSFPVANAATVLIHANHSLTVFNALGHVDVIIDLLGYYAPGASGTTGTTTQAPVLNPAVTTGAAQYAAGATVTYSGTGWNGCSDMRVDLVGLPGFTIAAHFAAAADGTFSGTFAAPTPITSGSEFVLLVQARVGGCGSALTAFTIT
jgi:hypothetical protein